ncbi:MAG: hypothetical protein U0K93_06025 [Acutalibacteraceae bacterium]|jgi:hypothetical protein|nr:hypothetical protein [Acutalibacteraceae bacterium]
MKTKKTSHAAQLFFKSMLYTVAAIALLVIGYFSAQFFFTNF